MTSPYSGHIKPRIIIHGGAGGISRPNLPAELYAAHRAALLRIVSSTSTLLEDPNTTALDAAVHAVSLLELDPLYNAGRGAVFTTAGRIEHEASVMVSDTHSPAGIDMRKRACASVRTSSVNHPIQLAREMLLRGGDKAGGGAGGHNCLSGNYVEGLAKDWGLEIEKPSWFWDRKRWSQHRQGLGLEDTDEAFETEKAKVDAEAGYDVQLGEERHKDLWTEDATWNGRDYLPQGTVGAVVLDRFGTICAATSTGGLTNKLPGRVGDTPTIGAGFWAESWTEHHKPLRKQQRLAMLTPIEHLLRGEWIDFAQSVLPSWMMQLAGCDRAEYTALDSLEKGSETSSKHIRHRAVGMSGTGNGDSFLRTCAARTAGAIARWQSGGTSLHHAVNAVAGSNGILQASAEDRFGKTGEGEGGIIGIELVDGKSVIVSDHNCGGMFRAWIDEAGKARMMVFKDEF